MLVVLTGSVVFGGCAPSSIRNSDGAIAVLLPAGSTRAVTIGLADHRRPEAKLERTSTSGMRTLHLGDASFKPTPPLILQSLLESHLPAQCDGMTVELTKFDVGVLNYGANSPRTALMGGMPLGAAGALADATVQTINSQRGPKSAYAEVEVRIGGRTVSSVEFVNLDAGLSEEAALAAAIKGAIDYLSLEIAAVVGPGKTK